MVIHNYEHHVFSSLPATRLHRLMYEMHGWAWSLNECLGYSGGYDGMAYVPEKMSTASNEKWVIFEPSEDPSGAIMHRRFFRILEDQICRMRSFKVLGLIKEVDR